jgi:hypothetical protein
MNVPPFSQDPMALSRVIIASPNVSSNDFWDAYERLAHSRDGADRDFATKMAFARRNELLPDNPLHLAIAGRAPVSLPDVLFPAMIWASASIALVCATAMAVVALTGVGP